MVSRRTISLTRLRTPEAARLEAAVALGDAAGRIVRLAERTVGGQGLTLPQFDVLTNLAMREGLTQQELAARLQVTKGNVCGLLDRLEKLGFVRRRQDEKDARINRLSITASGRETLEKIRPLHDAAINEFARNWDVADTDALQNILAKLGPVSESTSTRNPKGGSSCP